MSKRLPLEVKRSYKDGHIAVAVRLNCRNFCGDSARVDGSIIITTADARALAQSLIEYADREDVKIAAKAAAEARRRKWRDREVAAGRMTIMSMREVFRP